jgi:hypothetical protein
MHSNPLMHALHPWVLDLWLNLIKQRLLNRKFYPRTIIFLFLFKLFLKSKENLNIEV